jgi:hypothetical protein
MRISWRIGGIAAAGMLASAASAADKAPPRAPQMEALAQCRAIADSTQRLACYDKQVAALDDAERSHQVVIVDQDQVNQARRSLFGLHFPHITLFAGGGKDDDEPSQVTGKIATISRLGDGHVSFTTDDGAVWVQTDDFLVAGNLKPGGTVTIRKAALGSYFAKLEGRPGFKVARQNR